MDIRIFIFTVLDDAAIPLRKLIKSSASYWSIAFTKWGTEAADRDSLYFGGKETRYENSLDYLILATMKVDSSGVEIVDEYKRLSVNEGEEFCSYSKASSYFVALTLNKDTDSVDEK